MHIGIDLAIDSSSPARSAIARGNPFKFAPAYGGFLYYHKPSTSTASIIGGKIAQLNDLGGGAVHVLQGSAPARPTYDATALNGQPGAVYDGIASILDSAAYTLTDSPITRFLVFKVIGAAGTQILLDSTGQRQVFYQDGATNMSMFAAGVLTRAFTPGTGVHIATLRFNTGVSSMRIDGVQLGGTTALGDGGSDQLRYGASNAGASLFNGALGESFAYRAFVPDAPCVFLENRLKAIYGVA